MHPSTTRRITFFRDRLPEILETPNVTVDAYPVDEWETFDLPPLAKASGWGAPTVGAAVSDDPEDGFDITFRFCPELMARSTHQLPLSPRCDAGGEFDPMLWIDMAAPQRVVSEFEEDTAPLQFADNYLRLVEHVVTSFIIDAGNGSDVDVFDRAVDDLALLHPAASTFLHQVMAVALDTWLASRNMED